MSCPCRAPQRQERDQRHERTFHLRSVVAQEAEVSASCGIKVIDGCVRRCCAIATAMTRRRPKTGRVTARRGNWGRRWACTGARLRAG